MAREPGKGGVDSPLPGRWGKRCMAGEEAADRRREVISKRGAVVPAKTI